jgi:hypothetical protein
MRYNLAILRELPVFPRSRTRWCWTEERIDTEAMLVASATAGPTAAA